MGKRMGRPPKPPEEHYVTQSMRFPPDLWREFCELVKSGQRGKVVQRLVAREVQRLKRLVARQAEDTKEPAE